MQKRILGIFSALLLVASFAFGQDYPKAVGYVNDFAHLLSQTEAGRLNAQLIAFEKKTSIEIAVVTVDSLHGEDIESYTRELATKWGVGKKGRNNGVVLLVAPNERKVRIQAASGSQLADAQADDIRDGNILPRFKAHDMAGGIVAGTHAIMNALDSEAAAAADDVDSTSPDVNSDAKEGRSDSNTDRTSQGTYFPYPPEDSGWTAADTKLVEEGAGVLVGIGLLLLLIVPPIRRSQARGYVLWNKSEFIGKLSKAENVSGHTDVKEETRNLLPKIKDDYFASIFKLQPDSPGVNWIEERRQFAALLEALDALVSKMQGEIEYAEKARTEGPKLMKELPAMFEEAEKKLSKGKQSEKAAKQLAEAREQYAQAQSTQSGMSTLNWIILYELLYSSHSHCASAEATHTYVNTDHSSYTPSTSFPTTGFGSSGGFGGGGGFSGGGGGGSTGSW